MTQIRWDGSVRGWYGDPAHCSDHSAFPLPHPSLLHRRGRKNFNLQYSNTKYSHKPFPNRYRSTLNWINCLSAILSWSIPTCLLENLRYARNSMMSPVKSPDVVDHELPLPVSAVGPVRSKYAICCISEGSIETFPTVWHCPTVRRSNLPWWDVQCMP